MSPLTQAEFTHRPLAAFDFDGTLTRRDTLLPFLIRSLGWIGFLRAVLMSSPWLAAFALRLVSNHHAKARLLSHSLKGRDTYWAINKAKDFVKQDLPLLWHPWCMEKLRQHQALGHRCVIVSASPDIYLRAVADNLGIDDLICTEMEIVDGVYSGQMATLNCHGEEKVRRLKAWFNQAPPAEIHAYGDTKGDIPMLSIAKHAWYRGKPWRGKP